MNIAFKNLLTPALNRLRDLLPTLSGNKFCIGLDMGLDKLNLVQMRPGAQHLCISAIASLPYPCPREELLQQPKKLKAMLKQAKALQPFKGNRVVSCLPADQIKMMTIHYRRTENQTDGEAIAAELRERLKGELDNMVVDFMPLRHEGGTADKYDALVALAPRDKVLAYLDLLTHAGLEVDALDIGPAALARLVAYAGELHVPHFPKLPNALLINFGTDASYLTVIWGRRLMLDRAIGFCEQQLFKRLKQVLDMPEALAMRLLYEDNTTLDIENGSPDEANQMIAEVIQSEITALLQEVNKTLVYMASKSRGKSVDIIYLSGRVARYPGILSKLSEQLKVNVEILDPVAIFAGEHNPVQQHASGIMAGIALTTGLALRGVPEHG